MERPARMGNASEHIPDAECNGLMSPCRGRNLGGDPDGRDKVNQMKIKNSIKLMPASADVSMRLVAIRQTSGNKYTTIHCGWVVVGIDLLSATYAHIGSIPAPTGPRGGSLKSNCGATPNPASIEPIGVKETEVVTASTLREPLHEADGHELRVYGSSGGLYLKIGSFLYKNLGL
jgi:hypothetical protein